MQAAPAVGCVAGHVRQRQAGIMAAPKPTQSQVVVPYAHTSPVVVHADMAIGWVVGQVAPPEDEVAVVVVIVVPVVLVVPDPPAPVPVLVVVVVVVPVVLVVASPPAPVVAVVVVAAPVPVAVAVVPVALVVVLVPVEVVVAPVPLLDAPVPSLTEPPQAATTAIPRKAMLAVLCMMPSPSLALSCRISRRAARLFFRRRDDRAQERSDAFATICDSSGRLVCPAAAAARRARRAQYGLDSSMLRTGREVGGGAEVATGGRGG
jgi:hypothetical protein